MRFADLLTNQWALWGIGREGHEVLRTIRALGYTGTITAISDVQLEPPTSLGEIRVVTPEHFFSESPHSTVIVKSPGVSIYRDELTRFQKQGGTITSLTELWFNEELPGKKVVITGTKGKSTTATLMAHLLSGFGLRTTLAGNIGIPLSIFTPQQDFWVIELSSYQATRLQTEPDIAILLNLYPEHRDWHGSTEQYYSDKLDLFRHAGARTVSIYNANCDRTADQDIFWRNPLTFGDRSGFWIEDGVVFHRANQLFSTSELPLKGHHFHTNLLAVLTTLEALKLFDREKVVPLLNTFRGLPHRLEEIRSSGEVLYVNDSISTIPESAILAARAYQDRPVTLILGGFDRGQDWKEFGRSLPNLSVQHLITLPQNGHQIREGIELALSHLKPGYEVSLHTAENLSHAVRLAQSHTPSGGVVLLSPGSPSYGHYKNYAERGDAFRRAVQELP